MSTAIIGLGAMGLGMARNMVDAGIAPRGFDLSKDAMKAFADAGGTLAASVADAAKDCDMLVVMVVNADQARAILFDGGAAGAMTKGATVMLCSTVAPADAREIGAQLEAMGLLLLDAPVSGGQVGADAGALTVMASGTPEAFARAEPVLGAIAGDVFQLGDAPGIGATYKVVHQLAAGVHIVAAAELLALGQRAGCDPARLLEIVQGAAGASWMLGNRGPRMLQDDPPVASSVDIFLKDLGLVLRTAEDNEMTLPLTQTALEQFRAAADKGLGKADDSAVIRTYDKD